jgi:nucleotide-binding universal stress UspA family protein
MSTTTTASRKTVFSKILIAIDGSDSSMDASDYAISKQHNAELLYALHVIHPADTDLFGSTGEMTTAAYYIIDMNKEAQKYLDKVKELL